MLLERISKKMLEKTILDILNKLLLTSDLVISKNTNPYMNACTYILVEKCFNLITRLFSNNVQHNKVYK